MPMPISIGSRYPRRIIHMLAATDATTIARPRGDITAPLCKALIP